ncbi:MAG: carboxylating nicotinate-nucleotide diphosphorylase [Methylococcales bacterium]|nr:carboxylating nicotinate-nucleotide diphosphorylase [Methylococcales bacterium]
MITLPSKIDVSPFLDEDIGTGDVTALLIDETKEATATVITREPMILCGQAWFEAIFKTLDPQVKIHWQHQDSEAVDANKVLCTLSGNARALLTGERSALNIVQTLSATATQSKRYAEAVSETRCQVLDTRKTLPGLRLAQKYAVTCGGCLNHRIGLYDAVLIKENHILAAGSIEQAVKKARQQTTLTIEVEVESIPELIQAIAAKPNKIMLDNFSISDLEHAVRLTDETITLEASGDITLNNITQIAETGVDYISIGSLTKHINAINLSMRIELVSEEA